MPYKKKNFTEAQRNKKALELVQTRFAASKKYTQSYFTNFQRYYELYRSYLQKGRLPWRSNLFIPKTFEIIETVAPRISQAQRRFTVYPREGMDVNNARAYSDLLKYQFDVTNVEEVIEELVKETLIYGTGIMKVVWNGSSPMTEVVDIFDFFPDPKARNDGEFKYAIHRVYRDIEDLEGNPNYNPQVIAELKKFDGSKEDNQERRQRLSLSGTSSDDSTRKRFEVLEYHGLCDGKMSIITVVNDLVLRYDPSPYERVPFVVVNDHRVPHELYGIGEIEPIESLQNELNDIRNQRMDNVKLNINTMWKVVGGGVQFEDELVSRPGGIVHLTRPDGLIPNDRQAVPSEAFTEESVIKSDAERATGANTPLSGALTSPMGGTQGGVINRTASAFQGALNQADRRFSAKVNQIKRGLVKVGRMYLEYDQKFMTKPQIIRVIGDDQEATLVPVMPEDISKEFDLQVDVEYIDEFQQAEQDIQLLGIMREIPGFNSTKLAMDILENRGKKNVNEYLQKPQPPMPEPPRVNLQIRGNMAPDAVAKVLEKREGVRSNPDLVAQLMRAEGMKEKESEANILNTITPGNTIMPEEAPVGGTNE